MKDNGGGGLLDPRSGRNGYCGRGIGNAGDDIMLVPMYEMNNGLHDTAVHMRPSLLTFVLFVS